MRVICRILLAAHPDSRKVKLLKARVLIRLQVELVSAVDKKALSRKIHYGDL